MALIKQGPEQFYVCTEGSPWPGGDGGRALAELDRIIDRRIQRRVLTWDQHGRARVGFGLVGYARTSDGDLYLAPKCLEVSDIKQWASSVTAFLALCQDLTSRHVVISGPGAFGAGNVLLPWWADYYARALRRALDVTPFLMYQAYAGRLSYLRGSIDWPAQLKEWAHSRPRVACRFRRYQADHPLNRLLKWAAVRFTHMATSLGSRARLASCIEVFANVPNVPPEHASIDRIRIPASYLPYREPFVIAKALYESTFPTLAVGRIPSWGFVVDMVRAFEGFVDGLVHRAVRLASRRGRNWTCAAQDQELLASSVIGDGGAFYTRPDNVVWVIRAEEGKIGVVVDAKYKGVARDPASYRRPIGSDFYQVVVACVSRGWDRALIIAPATKADEAWKALEWAVSMPGFDHPVHVTLVKVDLRRLRATDEMGANVERLFRYLERALGESADTLEHTFVQIDGPGR